MVVGGAAATGPFPDGAWGSLSSYGVQVPVGAGEGDPTLPLSLTLGRWLLDRAVVATPVRLVGIEPDAAPGECAALGAALGERSGRVGLLVMGDGSARRSLKGPGGLHPDAEAFDIEVEKALRAGDADALSALDPDRAAALLAAGRAPWQVLAGAATDGRWRGSVTWAGSPYGVTYLVASWTAAG